MRTQEEKRKQSVFAILSSEIREKIVRNLDEKPLAFSELSRSLNISSSKLNFHLKKMEAFIENKSGRYQLAEAGKMAMALLTSFETVPKTEDHAKIASIGLLIDPNDIDFNIKEAFRNIDTISSMELDLVCLPFINISRPRPVQNAIEIITRKAQNLHASISFGFFELSDGKSYYSTVLVTPRGDFTVYRGTHKYQFTSFSTDIEDEIVAVDTEIGKIGLICKDEYIYPELFRIHRLRGSDHVVCPTFGMQEKFQRILRSILLTRTIENQMTIALSSSSFFKKEIFSVIYSPTQEIPSESNASNITVSAISMKDIERNRDWFKCFFPRRPELYGELVKQEGQPPYKSLRPVTPLIFPIIKIVRKYDVHNEDFVQLEETTTFKKPLHINIPMTGYLRGILPLKDAHDIEWFDDLGPLDAAITRSSPYIEYLTPNRFVFMPGELYSTGFRCKTSDPIRTEGMEILLNFSFEDFNKLYEVVSYELEEWMVEVLINPRFKFISSTPTRHVTTRSKKGEIYVWRWPRPKKLAPLKMKLSKSLESP